jgi:WD40 repeat protein
MRTPLASLAFLVACAPGGNSTVDEHAATQVTSIELVPSEVTLLTSSDVQETQQFQVKATFQDGEVDPNFDLVEWSMSNTTAGEIDAAGLFTASATNGGKTLLTAEVNGSSASADITVIYEEEVVEEGVPDGVSDAFTGSAEDAAGLIAWAYPEDGVALPRNLPSMDFMWADESGADVYQLTFSSSTTEVTVYTTATTFAADGDLWAVITSTNAGDDVAVELKAAQIATSDGAYTAVANLWDVGSVNFRVSRFDAEGAIYYWSTIGSAIVRAETDAVETEEYFSVATGTTTRCVGCHILSADGDRLAYTWMTVTESTTPRVGLAEIASAGATPTQLTAEDTTALEGYYTTIDPTGTWRLTSNDGDLYIYDAVTGDEMGVVDSDYTLTMPDWSPDGTQIVAIAPESYNDDESFGRGRLVVMEHLGDAQFGEPVVLVGSDDRLNNYYPMFSPDGKWIAFNRADGTSYFNEYAALWLIDANGGDPIELERANLAAGLTNSWPRWAPLPDDDVLWLAFASRRDYGTQELNGLAQVWIAAVDTYVAETGADPSYPAYRMVQQDVATSNHTPWWSLY